MISPLSAQNKKLTLYYPDTTKVVNIAGLDSMSIFICGASKVKHDGKEYNTVLIGNQCWLKENLDVGTMINSTTNSTNNGILEKYCYNNLESNCTTYGGLYQWNEAMQYVTTAGTKGICPEGWHLPRLEEFQTLSTAVSGDGNALKKEDQGSGGGQGTNTSGFSALLAGGRNSYGSFSTLGSYANFWSSTEHPQYYEYVYLMILVTSNSNIELNTLNPKSFGQSVRCLKD